MHTRLSSKLFGTLFVSPRVVPPHGSPNVVCLFFCGYKRIFRRQKQECLERKFPHQLQMLEVQGSKVLQILLPQRTVTSRLDNNACVLTFRLQK